MLTYVYTSIYTLLCTSRWETTFVIETIKAAEKLRDAGYVVDRVVAIVDRQEGGSDAMKEVGLELKSLFTLEELVNGKLAL